MTKKVVYFTAGAQPSADELADIQSLEAIAVPLVQAVVATATEDAKYDPNLIGADHYVSHDGAGTAAAGYTTVALSTVKNELGVPTCPDLEATQAIVDNAGTQELTDGTGATGVDVVFAVAGSEITAATVANTHALVELSKAYAVDGGDGATVTITIDNGALKFTYTGE